MKTFAKILQIVIIFATFFCSNSNCQTTKSQGEDKKLRTFGFGINIQPVIGFYETPSQFIFSLNVEDKFRIEPKFGFSSSSFLADEEEENSSRTAVGIGVYGLKYISQILFTYGIEYNHFSYRSDVDRYNTSRRYEDKANGVGPSLGLEYLIGKHFSFGAGFSIIYLKKKDLIHEDLGYRIIDEEIEYKEWATKAGLQFRFYF